MQAVIERRFATDENTRDSSELQDARSRSAEQGEYVLGRLQPLAGKALQVIYTSMRTRTFSPCAAATAVRIGGATSDSSRSDAMARRPNSRARLSSPISHIAVHHRPPLIAWRFRKFLSIHLDPFH